MFVIARTNRATNNFDFISQRTSLTPTSFTNDPHQAIYFKNELDALDFWNNHKHDHTDDISNPIYRITISEITLNTTSLLSNN